MNNKIKLMQEISNLQTKYITMIEIENEIIKKRSAVTEEINLKKAQLKKLEEENKK